MFLVYLVPQLNTGSTFNLQRSTYSNLRRFFNPLFPHFIANAVKRPPPKPVLGPPSSVLSLQPSTYNVQPSNLPTFQRFIDLISLRFFNPLFPHFIANAVTRPPPKPILGLPSSVLSLQPSTYNVQLSNLPMFQRCNLCGFPLIFL